MAAAIAGLLAVGCGGGEETDSALNTAGLQIVDWERSLIREVEGDFDAGRGELVVTATPDRVQGCDEAACHYLLRAPVGSDEIVESASSEVDDVINEPVLSIDLTPEGEALFREVTRSVARRPGGHMGVILDGNLLSLPSIDPAAAKSGVDGRAGIQIAGGFTEEEAEDLASALSAS